jgi:hypothetical protein
MMTPISRLAALALAASCLLPAATRGQVRTPSQAAPRTAATTPCRVDGVWELVSVSEDGKERALSGYQQRKILSRGHFMWLGQAARRDTIVMRTVADTLRATQVLGGSGTYSVNGDNYTERLDYFFDPHGIGQTLAAKCRVEGDLWYHSFDTPFGTEAGSQPKRHVVEVWRRVQ